MSPYANFLAEPGHLDYREVPPAAPGEGEIVVDIAVALTDGTDLKAFLRGHPKIAMPGPFGHEFAGVVSAVGPGVDTWSPGDRIVSTHTAPCGDCFYCRKGQANLCKRFLDFITMGAYADQLVLPRIIHAQNAFRLPEHVPFERAACLEPFACVVHGQRVVAPAGFDGRNVLIVGDGAIGLMHLLLARRRGAAAVALLGQKPERLALAAELGAEVATTEPERIRAWAGAEGADVVLECVGLVEVWHTAFAWVRPGGALLLFGGPPTGTTVTWDTAKLHYGEVTVAGCFHYTPDDVREAFRLLTEEALPLEQLVTHRLPLSRLGEAFAGMQRGEGLKYAIVPDARWHEAVR